MSLPDALAPLRGIFFDLDDTLIGYAEAEQAALRSSCLLAARLNPAIHAITFAHAIYDIYKTRFAYGTPGYTELASLPIGEFRRRLTEAALRQIGVTPDPSLVPCLMAAYDTAEAASLKAFPEAKETLAQLRPHFKLGVITNGPSTLQRAKLAALALDGFFDAIIVDTEFGHPKPDPRIFAHAAQRFSLAPESLLFVGNSLAYDITGARCAGWISVWMNPSSQPLPPHFGRANASTPDYIIHHLSDLLTLPPVARSLPTESLRVQAARTIIASE
jgi:putative hydrolase of the HAD superfamily